MYRIALAVASITFMVLATGAMASRVVDTRPGSASQASAAAIGKYVTAGWFTRRVIAR